MAELEVRNHDQADETRRASEPSGSRARIVAPSRLTVSPSSSRACA
jgi:hypothetical protein